MRMTAVAQRWLSPISGTPQPAYVVTKTADSENREPEHVAVFPIEFHLASPF